MSHIERPVRVVQDGPPPGGYKPVSFARHMPAKNISSLAMFGMAFGVTAVGFMLAGRGNRLRRCVSAER